MRRLTQSGQTIHNVFDLDGNRIAEYLYDEGTGTSTLIREYIWLHGQVIGVWEGGQLFYVRSDHIGRPVFATNDLGFKVWEASYLPFGGVQASSGPNIGLRFPGQWFQSESGLHQNWMRDYDPTTGRYIQADPLGLVDGASVYGYALQNPGRYVDPTGLASTGSKPGNAPKIGSVTNGPSCGDPCEPLRERVRRAKAQRPKACTFNDSVMTLYYKMRQWKELCQARQERDAKCPPIGVLPGGATPQGETERRIKDCGHWAQCNSILRRRSLGLLGQSRLPDARRN
ncbi:MAG: RHS repeat-associated core domain-containing protein [Pseudomonadota bacterium]